MKNTTYVPTFTLESNSKIGSQCRLILAIIN